MRQNKMNIACISSLLFIYSLESLVHVDTFYINLCMIKEKQLNHIKVTAMIQRLG